MLIYFSHIKSQKKCKRWVFYSELPAILKYLPLHQEHTSMDRFRPDVRLFSFDNW